MPIYKEFFATDRTATNYGRKQYVPKFVLKEGGKVLPYLSSFTRVVPDIKPDHPACLAGYAG